MLVERGIQGGGGERGEKWDNCNSIINKIFLKMKFGKKKYNKGVKHMIHYIDEIMLIASYEKKLQVYLSTH